MRRENLETFFEKIPIVLYDLIQEYLTRFSCASSASSMDYWCFLSTSKKIFETIKRETIHYQLVITRIEDFSVLSYLLEKKIINPSQQLTLLLDRSNAIDDRLINLLFNQLQNWIEERNFRKYDRERRFPLEIQQSPQFGSFLSGISLLKAPYDSEELEGNLNYKKNLLLHLVYQTRKYINIERDATLQTMDASPENYRNKNIRLRFCSMMSVKSFQYVKVLSLSQCHQIREAPYLSSLSKLTIHHCHSFNNLEGFGDIRSLFLIGLKGITDISPLKNNYILGILECENIKTGLDSLKNITHFRSMLIRQKSQAAIFQKVSSCLYYITEEPEIPFPNTLRTAEFLKGTILCRPQFSQLFQIYFNRCNGNSFNTQFLYSVPIVKFNLCSELQDISGLGGNKYVQISYCENLRNFSSLKNVKKVLLQECSGFSDAHEVEDVQDLEIHDCNGILDVNPLSKCKRLSLRFTQATLFQSLQGLGNIPVLELFINRLPLPESGKNEQLVFRAASEFSKDPLLTNYDWIFVQKQKMNCVLCYRKRSKNK